MLYSTFVTFLDRCMRGLVILIGVEVASKSIAKVYYKEIRESLSDPNSEHKGEETSKPRQVQCFETFKTYMNL